MSEYLPPEVTPERREIDYEEKAERSRRIPKHRKWPKDDSHFSRAYLLGPVKRDHADLALLACSFVTGMVDAASFSNWSAFVGMQTGKLGMACDCQQKHQKQT